MPFVNGALKAQHAKLVTVVGKARKEAKREVRNMEVKEDLKKALEAKLKVTTNENKALYAKIDALTTQTGNLQTALAEASGKLKLSGLTSNSLQPEKKRRASRRKTRVRSEPKRLPPTPLAPLRRILTLVSMKRAPARWQGEKP